MENWIKLDKSERIDDLLNQDLKIIQSDEVFSFSIDAVLLSRFCTVPLKGRIMDLCTGNGVIPLLLSSRTKAQMTGIEIQPRLADMARRSVKMNRLEKQIDIIEGDLKELKIANGESHYDLITVNPPYLPSNSGDKNPNEHFAIARHELRCTLEDVISTSARMVKSGGKVAMVHRSSRLADIVTQMRAYRMEPKRIRFIHPKPNTEANMVLIEAIRDGKPELRVLPPLTVYNEKQEYCSELMKIYYGQANTGGTDADTKEL